MTHPIVPYREIKTMYRETGFTKAGHVCPPHECGFVTECWHAHEWDGGPHSGHGYNHGMKEFLADSSELLALTQEIFTALDAQTCILTPAYLRQWFAHWRDMRRFSLYHQADAFLRAHRAPRTSDAPEGIFLRFPEDREAAALFLRCGFAYLGQAVLFFPQKRWIVSGTHHMGVCFYTPERDEALESCALRLAENYPNCRAGTFHNT